MLRYLVGILLLFSTVEIRAADRDDLYVEMVGATSMNVSGRHRFGAVVGYLPRDDIGLGFSIDNLFSQDLETRDKSAVRGSVELRWFQEPFEFSGDIGIMRRSFRDSTSQALATVGVTTAYLVALTPSLSAKADFSFLFLDDPRVLFSGGAGFRVLF